MNKRTSIWVTFLVVASLLVFVSASVARADDDDFKRFGIKIGASYIMPDGHFAQNFTNITESLGLGQPGIGDALSPMVNLEYFLFKPGTCGIPGTFSAELVLTVSKHDVTLANGAVNAGSAWILPPSLFLKYHPCPLACISPYVGFGFNVVMPFDEKLAIFDKAVSLSIADSVGWAVKFGFDIPIYKCKCFNLYYNAEAMYYDTQTDLKIAGGPTKFNVDINPWIVFTGVGIRF